MFPNVRILTEAAAMVGLASILYLIKVYQLPQAGSVTAGSMVPILFLALRRGPAIGAFAGGVFGLIQYLSEPFFVHPIQFLLDYPLAIAALGIAGFFSRRLYIGVSLALGARFLCHFLSGVIFFSSYGIPGLNPITYSIVYNIGYLLPELIISLVIIYLLRKKIDYDI
ncbi:MAG: energy-coupled thiamine transporter ThiT [Firmicutes bacterium]|nr:energy-coupled thiamine transporter ThiT [Bacillota bacterium]